MHLNLLKLMMEWEALVVLLSTCAYLWTKKNNVISILTASLSIFFAFYEFIFKYINVVITITIATPDIIVSLSSLLSLLVVNVVIVPIMIVVVV